MSERREWQEDQQPEGPSVPNTPADSGAWRMVFLGRRPCDSEHPRGASPHRSPISRQSSNQCGWRANIVATNSRLIHSLERCEAHSTKIRRSTKILARKSNYFDVFPSVDVRERNSRQHASMRWRLPKEANRVNSVTSGRWRAHKAVTKNE